ncbi:hypothetical protein A2U01_0114347, partial [Trifolium medium]|nr:hypothetical protein [Trifolium medium]
MDILLSSSEVVWEKDVGSPCFSNCSSINPRELKSASQKEG